MNLTPQRFSKLRKCLLFRVRSELVILKYLGGIAGKIFAALSVATDAANGGVFPPVGQCGTMQASWTDNWLAPHFKIPDVWWMRMAPYLALNPAQNNRLPSIS